MRATHEIWTATALLHLENPARQDFTVAEIVARAVAEHPQAGFRSSLADIAISQGIAANAPGVVHCRLLTATQHDRRRLYREGDACHPARTTTRTCPLKSDLPARYHHLIDWYLAVYCPRPDLPVPVALFGAA